jgi:2'-5' RNA ligase
MNVIRAFIAIDLSKEVCQNLEKVIKDLKEGMGSAPVRWMPAKNIHLTIKFLGDVSVGNLDLLSDIIQSEVNRHPSFDLSVGGLGTFPSIRRPRVIWVGVKAPAELDALHRGVEAEMAHLGYAPEDRPFSPHLTLGRVARNVNSEELLRISDTMSNIKVGFLGATHIEAVHLYRSDLQPGGAVYSRLFTASLINAEAQKTQ